MITISFASPLITPAVIHRIEKTKQGMVKKRFIAWAKIIEKNKNKTERQKLILVNDFFNQFVYRSDRQSVGRNDYWMTPVEFIIRGGGDCEDFSIVKYFTLLALGISESKLRITYVNSLEYKIAHMVLTYYPVPSAEPLVLDNLISQIKPASKRTDLQPVYSFNGVGLWFAVQRNQGRRISGSNNLSLWKDLNRRILADLK